MGWPPRARLDLRWDSRPRGGVRIRDLGEQRMYQLSRQADIRQAQALAVLAGRYLTYDLL